MKLSHTLLATAAMLALADPAFAQSATPTLLTTSRTTQAAVTTTIAPACAITGSLQTFLVGVTPNAGITLPSDQPVTLTCNTPDGSVTIGSSDMINSNSPDIIETAAFTNVIKFRGEANEFSTFYRLSSRTGFGASSSATVGNDTTRRIRTLQIGVRGVAPDANKLPIAGAYSGLICVTVDPTSSLGTGGSSSVNVTCAASGPSGPPTGGPEPEFSEGNSAR